MAYSLGIDASTQSCSAIVIDVASGLIVAEASVQFGEDLPQYESPQGFLLGGEAGEVHANPLMWLEALELMLERLCGECDLSKIEAISGAGQQHGTVYLNEHWFAALEALPAASSLTSVVAPALSRATSPIWMDSSTAVVCGEIAQAMGGDAAVCAQSGSAAIERFSGPQIRRFYQKDSVGYAQTARIHLVSSFLCSILCGVDAPVDTGDGAGMNLLNVESWDWDADLLEATAPDLHRRLPKVVTGQTTAGYLSAYYVNKYGFSPDIAVTVFTGDNPSSLVGMAASEPGKTVISLGTSDTFFAAMPGVVTDPHCHGHAFGNPMGGAMSLQCFVNGSLAREAIRDQFGYDWDAFTQALQSTPAGNGGSVMLPFFRPEISPRLDVDAPLLLDGDRLDDVQEAKQMIRACVEGQFLNMRLQTEWMQLQPDLIYLTGGASDNDAIAQVVADVFQVQVARLAVSGAVALGAAMRAAEHTLGADMRALEQAFCAVDTARTKTPQVDESVYQASGQAVVQLLKAAAAGAPSSVISN